MKKWTVTENRTGLIWREYVQNIQPERDDSWPREGDYTLAQITMDAATRRQWAKDNREDWLTDKMPKILDAILLNQLGDSEILTEIATTYQTKVLNKFPKDPAP